jgi:hypothetical protein
MSNLAIAYAMKKKSKKMAEGGHVHTDECYAHGGCTYMAKGGDVERDPNVKGVHQVSMIMNEGPGDSRAGDFARSGYKHKRPDEVGVAKEEHRKVLDEMKSMPKRDLHGKGYAEGGEVDDDHDMVSRIMKNRYSEGGQVANDDMPVADSEENQFDDMPKDDDMEFCYTGANSGDEVGDEQEDEDEHDMVSRIMKSRLKKDRMPHPA